MSELRVLLFVNANKLSGLMTQIANGRYLKKEIEI
jgi:hypothetical protein